jgi:hypothetical protein
MLATKPQEAKRSELIDELLRRHEPLIARAVESAAECSLTNGHLFLNYQYPFIQPYAEFAGWVISTFRGWVDFDR